MSEENYDEDVVENEDQQDDDEQAILDAFSAAISDEADEDEVKLQMISAGATFKNVTRLYNKFMIDAGLAISKSDRNQIVEDTLEGMDFDTEEGFANATSLLVDAITGSTERQASALVRSYAKKNDMECYVKPKGEGGTRSSWRGEYYTWLTNNLDATEADAKAYIMGEGDYPDTTENVQKHLSAHLNVYNLVQRVVDSARG